MKHILLLSVLFLGASWVVAQDPATSGSGSTSGQTSSQGYGQTNSGQMSGSGQMSSSHQTVQGCLSGSDGKYTLTDKSGNSYQLSGDTSKLAEHVGHEVKITGSTGSASASGGMGQTSTSGGQTLEVASVKHISKTCSSGGMSK